MNEQLFPTTLWSDILAATDPTRSDYRDALERLCRAYWKPVYVFVRTRWGRTIEDATDLTQAFFAHLLEKGIGASVHPDRGSFRAYLKRALKNFLIDAHRSDAARRPAQGALFSLEASRDECERLMPAAADEPPESAYDRVWFRCLIDESVRELEAMLRHEGKGAYFDVFRLYCVDPLKSGADESLTYGDVAARLGLQETDVRNYLAFCRAALRKILRGRIRDYVDSDEAVEVELQELLLGGS
ncbi:MAG: sigma-70 family RNA polymerase sigma factor [Planctomycetes bacterium]|nr:sigma-70 family RNA polymerase sigma factor [Planctomycetota bacterium]